MLGLRTVIPLVAILSASAALRGGQAQPLKDAIKPATGCIPRAQCCRICTEGKACGNWCTKAIFNCDKVRGCACDASKVCRQ